MPVNVGLLIGAFNAKPVVTSAVFAFESNAVCVAVLIGLFTSLVLSALPKPTIVLSIPATVPVNVGLLIFAFNAKPVVMSAVFAFKSNAVCVAVLIGLFASLVLSTLPKPTIVLVIPLTVPVKVGEAIFAFNARLAVTSEVFAFDVKPGTVGKAAVPPKSPANCILPFVVIVASGVISPDANLPST